MVKSALNTTQMSHKCLSSSLPMFKVSACLEVTPTLGKWWKRNEGMQERQLSGHLVHTLRSPSLKEVPTMSRKGRHAQNCHILSSPGQCKPWCLSSASIWLNIESSQGHMLVCPWEHFQKEFTEEGRSALNMGGSVPCMWFLDKES